MSTCSILSISSKKSARLLRGIVALQLGAAVEMSPSPSNLGYASGSRSSRLALLIGSIPVRIPPSARPAYSLSATIAHLLGLRCSQSARNSARSELIVLDSVCHGRHQRIANPLVAKPPASLWPIESRPPDYNRRPARASLLENHARRTGDSLTTLTLLPGAAFVLPTAFAVRSRLCDLRRAINLPRVSPKRASYRPDGQQDITARPARRTGRSLQFERGKSLVPGGAELSDSPPFYRALSRAISFRLRPHALDITRILRALRRIRAELARVSSPAIHIGA